MNIFVLFFGLGNVGGVYFKAYLTCFYNLLINIVYKESSSNVLFVLDATESSKNMARRSFADKI